MSEYINIETKVIKFNPIQTGLVLALLDPGGGGGGGGRAGPPSSIAKFLQKPLKQSELVKN